MFPAWIHALDLQILYLINQTWSRPWLDPIIARVSDFDTFRYPIIACVVLTLIFGGFRGRQFLILMAACLMIGDGIINWDFKIGVNRPRPNETEPHLRVVDPCATSVPVPASRFRRPYVAHGRSFTSGHACNNVALAMVELRRSSAAGRSGSGRGRRSSAIRASTSGPIIRATFLARAWSRSFTPTSF